MLDKNLDGYLTISEFAKIAGCKREKLIYYDRIGLLKPSFTGQNGYRYYKHNQMETMFVITTLASMHVKLKDIRTYLNLRKPEHTLEFLKKQSAEIQKQIDKLQSTKNLINSRIDHLYIEKKVKLNQVQIITQDEQFLFVSKQFTSLTDKIPGKIWTDFWYQCKLQNISCGYPIRYIIIQENVVQRKYKQISYVFINLNQEDVSKENQVVAKNTYAVIYGKCHYGNTDKLYNYLYHYLRDNKLAINGPAYEEYLTDEVDTKDPDNYLVKISIPIK